MRGELHFNPKNISKKWANPKGAAVHALHDAAWGNWGFVLEGRDDVVHSLEFAEGGWQEQTGAGWGSSCQGFFVEGVAEELDSPGEFLAADETTIRLLPNVTVGSSWKAEVVRDPTTWTFLQHDGPNSPRIVVQCGSLSIKWP